MRYSVWTNGAATSASTTLEEVQRVSEAASGSLGARDQLNATGFIPGAVTVTRPTSPGGITQQVMYGPLGDVDYIISDAMNPSYQPGIETTTCATCHQYNSDPDHDQDFDEPGSVTGQSTYSEWVNSPYGADPSAPEYQTCADCHMPAVSNDGCVVVSVPREPVFCALNLARGKNVTRLGNDPEHINHWGRRGFLAGCRGLLPPGRRLALAGEILGHGLHGLRC